MKLEDLKVGQYVRTKLGIGKIVSKVDDINDYYYNCWIADNKIGSYDNTPFSQLEYFVDNEVIKASFNIIDILEVEDIISFYEDIDNYKKQYVIGIPDLITLDKIKDKITNDNIRLVNILTKEQMEQRAYKVGE